MASKPRTAIPGPRQTGTITAWKDKFGWIEPSKPINHPAASKRGGKIFIGIEDVVEELDGVGATVSFTLYSDATGLGAADVKMGKAPPATPAKGAAKGTPANGKSAAKGGASGYQAPAAKAGAKPAAPKTAAAKAAAAKAAAKVFAQKRAPPPVVEEEEEEAEEEAEEAEEEPEEPPMKKFKGYGKDKGKGKEFGKDFGKGKDWGKGKGKGKKKGKDKGPGVREMIHDEPLTGSVIDWKGAFGWIKPNDTIDHPLAQKHHGDLYFTQDDVEDEIEGVGAEVQFMLYQDRKGLGACSVKPA